MSKTMGLALAMLLAATPALAADPKVGKPAPDFQLTLIDGSKVSLAELKGQVVILNFWATWCVPCRKELPLLDAYYQLQERTGIRIFAVTTEDSVPIYRMKALFAVLHLTPAKHIKGPYSDLGAVPTNYVIDRAGTLRYAKAGAFAPADLDAIVRPLLAEPAPAG